MRTLIELKDVLAAKRILLQLARTCRTHVAILRRGYIDVEIDIAPGAYVDTKGLWVCEFHLIVAGGSQSCVAPLVAAECGGNPLVIQLEYAHCHEDIVSVEIQLPGKVSSGGVRSVTLKNRGHRLYKAEGGQ